MFFKKIFIYFVVCFLIFYGYKKRDFFKKKLSFLYKKKDNISFPLDFTKKNYDTLHNKCVTTLIIGSGPAGCSAGLYAARMGGKALILGGKNPGGLLMTTGIVENWPGIINLEGPTIMANSRKQAEMFGADFIDDIVENIDVSMWPFKVTTKNNLEIYAYSIIVASGSNPKLLNVPGEHEYWSRGVSTCAVCDAPLYKNKDVIIVGGGDSACEEALQLSTYARNVTMFIRSNQMRASKVMQERVMANSKIKIIYNIAIQEIAGDENSVQSVLVNHEKNVYRMPIDGVFIAIGHTPNTNFVKNIVDIDENGLIVCQGSSQKSSFPGIYAAGDVENHYKQAGIAAGNAIKAAIDSYRFLQEEGITQNFIENNNDLWFSSPKITYASDIFEDEESEIICNENSCSIVPKKKKNTINQDVNSIEDIKTIDAFKQICNSNTYFLLDLYTDACPACVILKKALENYAQDFNTHKIYSLNVGVVSEIFNTINIQNVPTLILMRGNIEIARKSGSCSLNDLKSWIDSIIL